MKVSALERERNYCLRMAKNAEENGKEFKNLGFSDFEQIQEAATYRGRAIQLNKLISARKGRFSALKPKKPKINMIFQKLAGLALISIGTLPILVENDGTAALLLVPIGIAAIFTKESIM